MDDDGGVQYWQQLGLQQFNAIFKDEVENERNISSIPKSTEVVCTSIKDSDEPPF